VYLNGHFMGIALRFYPNKYIYFWYEGCNQNMDFQKNMDLIYYTNHFICTTRFPLFTTQTISFVPRDFLYNTV
jgi:hypothetical protein